MEVECGRNDYDISHGVRSTMGSYLQQIYNSLFGIEQNLEFSYVLRHLC